MFGFFSGIFAYLVAALSGNAVQGKPVTTKEFPRSLPGASRPRSPKSVRNNLETVSGVSRKTVLRLRRQSWNVLSREPSGDRIARSCRHSVPGLPLKDMKDRIRQKCIIAVCFGLLGPCQTVFVRPEIKQKQAQDRKTYLETVSLPVAKILTGCHRRQLSAETVSKHFLDPRAGGLGRLLGTLWIPGLAREAGLKSSSENNRLQLACCIAPNFKELIFPVR